MLHTKFQANHLFGSEEQDFKDFFKIYGHDGHFGRVTLTV